MTEEIREINTELITTQLDLVLRIVEIMSEKLDAIATVNLSTKAILNFDEVCDYLGISKSHGYKVLKNNIPYSKPNGKTMYFRREDVEEYMMKELNKD